MKRFWSILLACVLMFCCTSVPVSATEAPETSFAISRVSGRLDFTIPANTTALVGDPFSLDQGETIAYNCTYTPKSASVDFGYIAPNGLFYSLNCTSGSHNKSIKVAQRGEHQLAIRNNENYAVTVSGTVRY